MPGRSGGFAYAILGVPYCKYSVMGPKTLFYLYRPPILGTLSGAYLVNRPAYYVP